MRWYDAFVLYWLWMFIFIMLLFLSCFHYFVKALQFLVFDYRFFQIRRLVISYTIALILISILDPVLNIISGQLFRNNTRLQQKILKYHKHSNSWLSNGSLLDSGHKYSTYYSSHNMLKATKADKKFSHIFRYDDMLKSYDKRLFVLLLP